MFGNELDDAPLPEQATGCRLRARDALYQASVATDPIDKETKTLAARGWLMMAFQIDLLIDL
jgi:hypothetical protein